MPPDIRPFSDRGQRYEVRMKPRDSRNQDRPVVWTNNHLNALETANALRGGPEHPIVWIVDRHANPTPPAAA